MNDDSLRFVANGLIRIALECSFGSKACALPVELCECPERMAANKRLRITGNPFGQHRHAFHCADVSCCNRRVAKQSSPFRSRKRRAAKSVPKFGVSFDRKQLAQVEPRTDAGARLKLRPARVGRESIERANILTNVAAEDPFAHRAAQLSRNGEFVLNRQIRDASS